MVGCQVLEKAMGSQSSHLSRDFLTFFHKRCYGHGATEFANPIDDTAGQTASGDRNSTRKLTNDKSRILDPGQSSCIRIYFHTGSVPSAVFCPRKSVTILPSIFKNLIFTQTIGRGIKNSKNGIIIQSVYSLSGRCLVMSLSGTE